jgi:hypothetical protein
LAVLLILSREENGGEGMKTKGFFIIVALGHMVPFTKVLTIYQS